MAKKFYGFDEAGKRRYSRIEKKVLGSGRQTHLFKKWNRSGNGRKEFIITGLATAAVTSGDSTFTIDNLANVTPGALPSSPLTVKNTLTLTLADNQKVYAIRNLDGDYETWAGGGEQGPAGESTLFAEFTATATSSHTTDTVTGDIDHSWGGTPASTTGVTVHKLSDHDVTIYSGDKFIGVWDTEDDEWKLLYYDGMRVTIKGTVSDEEGSSDVTAATSTFELENITLVNGWRMPGTVTVTNDPPIWATMGSTVYARFNLTIGSNPLESWDTGDGGNFLPKLKGIGSYNAGGNINQVPGHNEGTTAWFGMASICLADAAEAVADTDGTFDADGFVVLCGATPETTAGVRSVSNVFGFTIDDNGKILVVKDWDADTWYCIQAECPA